MKLTKPKLLETIRALNNGATTYQARKIAGISVRRTYQIKNEYLRTGKIPEIGKAMGRPTHPITKYEREIVEEAYKLYRVSASTLEKLIDRDYSYHIPHNTIHKILVNLGFARKKKKKDIRKKTGVRYERRHSLTAVHIDWHYSAEKSIWVFLVIDDASRKVLSLIETKNATTEESIRGMRKALRHGRIKQCISDHGTQFVKTMAKKKSKFQTFLEENGIKQILCRIKHPQSNGKAEKFFHLYDIHRWKFKHLKEFVNWYNVIRPHRSLNFKELETPDLAFHRKMKAEV